MDVTVSSIQDEVLNYNLLLKELINYRVIVDI